MAFIKTPEYWKYRIDTVASAIEVTKQIIKERIEQGLSAEQPEAQLRYYRRKLEELKKNHG